MIAIAVTWMAKPGHEDAVAEVFRYLMAESRKEPGCLLFQVHRHPDDARRFFIYEQFRDQAGLDAHRIAPHFVDYAKAKLPAIADRLEGQIYQPLEEAQS